MRDWASSRSRRATGNPPSDAPETVEPEIVTDRRHPRVEDPILPVFPDFGTMAGRFDKVARRFPWWLWLTLGVVATVWSRKGFKLPKLFSGGSARPRPGAPR